MISASILGFMLLKQSLKYVLHFYVSNNLLKHFLAQRLSVQNEDGGEFCPFQTSLNSMGVSYRLSCPHTHHQMSSVKRKHHHIVEIGLSLLATANVPLTLWDLAFEPTTYLINRLPSKVTQKKSPYECLFNISHDYKFLKTFGCECWPFLRPYNSIKLSFRSTSCVFIGYNKNHLGYKCLHISSDRVYIARHVVFNENNFPFLNSNPTRSSSPSTITTSVSVPLVAPSNHIHSRHHDDANSTPFLEPSPTASHTTEIDTESPYIDALIPLAPPTESEPAPSP
jgi:hypothetical protein